MSMASLQIRELTDSLNIKIANAPRIRSPLCVFCSHSCRSTCTPRQMSQDVRTRLIYRTKHTAKNCTSLVGPNRGYPASL